MRSFFWPTGPAVLALEEELNGGGVVTGEDLYTRAAASTAPVSKRFVLIRSRADLGGLLESGEGEGALKNTCGMSRTSARHVLPFGKDPWEEP